MRKLLLLAFVSGAIVQSAQAAEPTCANYVYATTYEAQWNYVQPIIRKLDLPSLARGCSPLNTPLIETLHMIDRICAAHDIKTYPLYNAVVDAYQTIKGTNNALEERCK